MRVKAKQKYAFKAENRHRFTLEKMKDSQQGITHISARYETSSLRERASRTFRETENPGSGYEERTFADNRAVQFHSIEKGPESYLGSFYLLIRKTWGFRHSIRVERSYPP